MLINLLRPDHLRTTKTRVGPDAVVIGAYKSGTTSLSRLLQRHPGLYLPNKKEINTLSRPNNVRNEARYFHHFARKKDRKAVEISPKYLGSSVAAAELARLLPSILIIAILRNPVERAYSDWLMHTLDGREKLKFSRALAAQTQRHAANLRTGHYIQTGLYARQLQYFFDVFDKSQLKIILFEEFQANPYLVLDDITNWIGATGQVEWGQQLKFNQSGLPASRLVAIVAQLRARTPSPLKWLVPTMIQDSLNNRFSSHLKERRISNEDYNNALPYFLTDILYLERLLGRDLSEWKARRT